MPLEFRVRAGTLDPADIPAGPFGHAIGIPWFEDDPKAAAYNQQMVLKSLRKLREYGFTDVQRPARRSPSAGSIRGNPCSTSPRRTGR